MPSTSLLCLSRAKVKGASRGHRCILSSLLREPGGFKNKEKPLWVGCVTQRNADKQWERKGFEILKAARTRKTQTERVCLGSLLWSRLCISPRTAHALSNNYISRKFHRQRRETRDSFCFSQIVLCILLSLLVFVLICSWLNDVLQEIQMLFREQN